MKLFRNTLLISGTALLMASCGANKSTAEQLEDEDYKNRMFQTIVSDEDNFTDLLEKAHNIRQAELILIKDHLDMMESGKVKSLVADQPELQQRMKALMQEKLNENPQLCLNVKDKLMEDQDFREAVMADLRDDFANDPEMVDMVIVRMSEDSEFRKEILRRMMEDEEMKMMIRKDMEEYEASLQPHMSKDGTR
ncbi:hypothetical protein [Zeaxanthinibacter enoshimensis]|uniref:Uncharacterized protein n=1 Tax=Zeaxanthinibacter enoshimensis TaxID=392009 RepID=A0A4R6TJW4_9FLAO|nr:hypothetical protein [Zeaxanthinibacter enoshimensis]TDQ31184.1 hypothetical protein CLV82_1888 [Zeaxanthinibacter enoshimensis]